MAGPDLEEEARGPARAALGRSAPGEAPPPVDRKARLRIPPQPLPKQDPLDRVRNWREVSIELEEQSAFLEATRCIQCPAAPCTKACPLHNDIPGALAFLENGDPPAAARIFRLTSPMPEVCGRLCPQERLCEGACVVGKKSRPVAIGRLEAFAADREHAAGARAAPPAAIPTGRHVAIVGAGPAGLAAAEVLALAGHRVTVVDAWPEAGGVLKYGIPTFKMDKEHVDRLVSGLERLGVEFVCSFRMTDPESLERRTGSYDALLLAHGAGAGNRLAIEGEELAGVHQATDFLVGLNLTAEQASPHRRTAPVVGRRVVVIGGGDTAMDCARSAIRGGAEDVLCAYRRAEAQMTGREDERRNAIDEGVRLLFQVVPIQIVPSSTGESAAGVVFQRVELGAPDRSGRAQPIPVPGSEFLVECETVVVAVGYGVDVEPVANLGLGITERGTVAVDSAGATSRAGVFAAGDNVRGADLVVTAVAAGRRAARSIDSYVRSKPSGGREVRVNV